jgi:hypothetical protein
MLALPIGISVINIYLLAFVFPYDTPPQLKATQKFEKLSAFMGKLYKKEYVQ